MHFGKRKRKVLLATMSPPLKAAPEAKTADALMCLLAVRVLVWKFHVEHDQVQSNLNLSPPSYQIPILYVKVCVVVLASPFSPRWT